MAGFLGLDELVEGRHFDREIIVLCVRWYLRFKLSFRDLVEKWPNVVCRWPTPPSCAGYTTMFRNSSTAGTASRGRSGLHNVSTRPTWQVGLSLPCGGSRGKDRRLPPRYSSLADVHERIADARLRQLNTGPTNHRVRAMITRRLSHGEISLAEIARALAMSERTLHRRLKDEGNVLPKIGGQRAS